MSRRLVFVNLALLALIIAAGWRLFVHANEVELRQNRFLAARTAPDRPPVMAAPQSPSPVSAAAYLDIAANHLLSQDRNPNVTVDAPPPPKPMPELPRYYGVFQLGGPPRVLLSEKQGAPQKSYQLGETVGEFKLVAVNQAGIIFEWDGKQVGARFEELRAKAEAAPPPTPTRSSSSNSSQPASTSSAPPASNVSTVSSVSSTALQKPGETISSTMRYCVPGDNSPEGSVVDGFRKVMRTTPFGKQCYWEKVQ